MKRLLGIVFLPVLVAGCFGSSAGSRPVSSSHPLAGVPQVVGVALYAAGIATNGNGNLHPYKFTKLVVFGHTATGSRLLRLVGTNAVGKFSMRLPPGRYLVELRAFHPAHTRFTVTPGDTTTVRLVNSYMP